MADSSVAPKQMQVRVTFYTIHNPQSILMILKHDCALEQITEKARQLFPSAMYRLYYGKNSNHSTKHHSLRLGDVNGPIYEFTESEQVMAKIRITSFSRTPQLFVRLEPHTLVMQSSKKPIKERESKSSITLKRIEQNQEQTMKSLSKLQKEFDRVTKLEQTVAELQLRGDAIQPSEPKKRNIKAAKHSATCDACLGDIIGHRYKCLECPDFDLCEDCEKNSVHYEHAMVRLVCPRKTSIPSYITANAPNNVFPSYMKAHVINLDIPIPMPAADEPKQSETSVDFRAETRAALIQSAGLLKDTFHTLSKSFLDLADGAQTGMDKKIFERSKMEAGMAMVEDKIEFLTRQCDEKYFGTPESKSEKDETDAPLSTPPEPKKKLNKRKSTVYKKAASKLSSSFLAALDKEEAKRRADASTAELQRKLAELSTKESKPDAPRQQPAFYGTAFPGFEHFGDYLRIGATRFDQWEQCPAVPMDQSPMQQDQLQMNQVTKDVPTPLSVLAAKAAAVQPIEPSAPLSIYPTIPTGLLAESQPIQQEKKAEAKLEPLVLQTAPKSIHSSFENIASDFETISPSWETSPSEPIGATAPEAIEAMMVPEMQIVDNSDDDMEFYDGEDTVGEETVRNVISEPQQDMAAADATVLSVVDAQTENVSQTFN